ncbi:hypothetical protein NI17_013800 [Thermobifida halotolerans]|uniref:Uncharacterized protein n=1 Tax=Thermobifida halotolerans TaxID=483545 RepID=A0AA97M2H1_9ACTN|nr:hypothetical protein [Thermobifida halotolerans]UOE17936.1 hypothetical protein NI17_013800 [Thermobifida halotolerans]
MVWLLLAGVLAVVLVPLLVLFVRLIRLPSPTVLRRHDARSADDGGGD